MRCAAIGERDRGRTQAADQHREPETEDRPVEGDPRIGIDGPHRPEGGEWREPHCHCDGNQRAEEHGGEGADEPVTAATTGLAPRARSTLRSSSPHRSWREIACIPSTKATRPAMAPNPPRATDSGLTASSTWAATTEVAWISYAEPGGACG